MLLMLQNLVFAGAFLAVMYLVGTLLLHIVGWNKTLIGATAWGFIAVMGIFQLIAYPLYLAKSSFSLLFYLFSAVMLVLFAASVVLFVRQKVWRTVSVELTQLWSGFRETPLPILLLGGMVLVALYYSVFYYTPTSTDDCYYLPRAMEVLAQNNLAVSHSVGWHGWQINGYPETTDASTIEFFRAYLSGLTGIEVTPLNRNGFLIALFILSLSSVWTFLNTFAQDNENAFSIKAYGLILWILFVFSSLQMYSQNFWIAHFLSQGKSLLPGIVFPMLFSACGQIMQHIDRFKFREWISVMLVLLAGVAVSIVGIFLTPILYFMLGISFLLTTRFKHFGRIVPCAVVSVLPVLVHIVISYLTILRVNQRYFEPSKVERGGWLDQMHYGMDMFMFVLFVLCVIYLFRRGSKLERALFAVMPTLLALTFLNPLLRSFVTKYVTSANVYWRLFWLLPVVLVPIYTIPTGLLKHLHAKGLQTMLIGACFCAGSFGGFAVAKHGTSELIGMFVPSSVYSEARKNVYNIDTDAYEIVDTVFSDWHKEERPMLLLYDEEFELNEIRQRTEKINLKTGIRWYQLLYQQDLIPGTQVRECDFYASYADIEDGAYLHDMLTRLEIDYVCFYEEPACRNPEDSGFTPLYAGEQLTLWRVDA